MNDNVKGVICLGVIALGLIILYSFGLRDGHREACTSIQAEWRDSKCVRVVVEEVK